MLCRETLVELSPETMSKTFQVNSVAPLYLLQLCAVDMLKHKVKGSIINISSIAGIWTKSKGPVYGASKAAVNKFTKYTALELAPHQIRVNAIAPGVIESGMNETAAKTDPDLWEHFISNIPLQSPGRPEDITNMLLYLASDQGKWITGKVFEIDGGAALYG